MGASILVPAVECENHVPNILFSPRLEVEATLGIADALNGRVVNEPAAAVARGIVDESAGQARSRAFLEDLLHDALLAGTSSDESNSHSVGDNGQGQRDALGWWLGAILDGGDPGGGLAQEFVAGKQRAGVTVGAATKQQEVEDGQADRVTARKGADQDLLIVIGDLKGLFVKLVLVDGIDLRLAGTCRNLVEQLLLQEAEVGVFVIQGHNTLVGEEDLPLIPLDGVLGTRRRREQCLG